MDKIPLIVLDTNVLVTGLCRREGSPSYNILRHIQNGTIPIALTQKLYLEYEAVLMRRAIQKLINANNNEIMKILEALLSLSYRSETFYLWRPNLMDEKDNFVLEAAITTGAILVTRNTDDFQSGDLQFPDLKVIRPQQFCDRYI